jgi:hypothetical protein
MNEEVRTGLGLQASHELSCSTPQRLFGALSTFAQERLEHAVGLLDRIEVRRVGRQIAQRCTGGFDRLANACDPMSGNIVHDDDVTALERWRQALLDIGYKDRSVHCSIDHHGRGHSVAAQRGYEGQCFPGSEGYMADHPLASQSAAVRAGHAGANRGFVDEDKAGRIKQPLLAYPAPTGAGDVRPLLFRRVQDFF